MGANRDKGPEQPRELQGTRRCSALHFFDPLPASDDAKIVDLWFHEAGRKAGITLSAAPADLIDEEDDPPLANIANRFIDRGEQRVFA